MPSPGFPHYGCKHAPAACPVPTIMAMGVANPSETGAGDQQYRYGITESSPKTHVNRQPSQEGKG